MTNTNKTKKSLRITSKESGMLDKALSLLVEELVADKEEAEANNAPESAIDFYDDRLDMVSELLAKVNKCFT